MGESKKLRLRNVTDGITAKVADIVEAKALERERQQREAEEVEREAEASRIAAAQAETLAASARRREDIADAVSGITGGVRGWSGIYHRDGNTKDQVRPLALEWTKWTSPGAREPSGAMIAAREAELVVKEWLEARLGAPIRDVSMETTFRDDEGPAFRRYDLLEETGNRRYDVKNTVAPPNARHVLGRDRPAGGVTLVGVGRIDDRLGARYELLGALDAADLAEWDCVLEALDGVGVLISPTVTRSGARVRPSWMFGSPRHPAFASVRSSDRQDPIERLDRLDAWSEVSSALCLLSRMGRASIQPPLNDAEDLLWRFALRVEALGVDRLELRHLYVLTLEDFRTRYRDENYDASIYERALLPEGHGRSAVRWRTPGGTWDPYNYYGTLVAGLKRLASHRAKLPEVIRTIHVTAAGTVIANYRRHTDRGGPPTATLLAMCGTRECESKSKLGGDSWLVLGEEAVQVIEPGGFLRCPTCGFAVR